MRALPSVLRAACSVACFLPITGCSTADISLPNSSADTLITQTLRGVAHGGQQPLAGAAVYLFAAGTTDYGSASISLLQSVTTGSFPTTPDGSGNYYVTTDANGNFSISSYTCNARASVYVYVLGGNAGAGQNSAVGLLGVLGPCPASGTFVGSIPFIVVNEVTTVAAAYALAGFTVDPTHIGSPSRAGALTGIANAVATANNLADITGSTNASGARFATPALNGFPPQAEINTLADILGACINSASAASAACTNLFADARLNGSTGALPMNTAAAIINIAHNPDNAVSGLFNIAGTAPPFQPTLSTAPHDWSVAILYNNGGGGTRIAVDGSGDVWTGPASLSEYSPLGVLLSPNGGYPSSGTFAISGGIAIDTTGNVWALGGTTLAATLNEFSNAGASLSGTGYPLSGVPSSIAIDPSNNPRVLSWVFPPGGAAGSGYSLISSFSPAGAALGTFTVPSVDYEAMAIDATGNTWITADAGKTSIINSSLTAYAGGPFSINPGATFVRIDANGNGWVTSDYTNSYPYSYVLTGVGLTGVRYTVPVTFGAAESNVIDGFDHVWTADSLGTVTAYSDTGTLLTPTGLTTPNFNYGFGTSTPFSPNGIAIDGSGNVWVTNGNGGGSYSSALDEIVGAAAPTITPLAAAVATGKLGSRP